MGKTNIFNWLSFGCSVLAVGLLFAGIFVLEGTTASIAQSVGVMFFVIWSIASKRAEKPGLDERQLKISAKANRWGLFAVMVYCIMVAVIAKDDPDFVSVPVALFGALASLLVTTFIAYRVLLGLPGADAEKWERK